MLSFLYQFHPIQLYSFYLKWLPQENFSEITSEWLLEKVNLQNKEVSTLAAAFDKIKSKDFDVLLTVGAGNIDTLYDGIVEWLENR